MSERDKKPITDAPEREPTPSEMDDAARLRDALEGRRAGPSDSAADLAFSLRAAWSPASLAADTLAEVIDDVPASADESVDAARLAASLGTRGEPEVVSALQAAWSPAELSGADHEALIRTATSAPTGRLVRFARVRRIAVVGTTALAAAAAIAIWLGGAPPEVPLARARSTTPLFDQPFGDGDRSARIDRIAVARAADYRDNRFASWGLR